MDELERRAGRDGQRRRGVRGGQPVGDAGRPADDRSAVSGESAWPWKRPSAMNVDSPCRTRTSVASRPSGTSGPRSAAQRVPPRRIVHRSRTASWLPDRLRDGLRHVVVEGQDHERVLARPGPGEVHRADVDVRLAEHDPDPPDRPWPVHVAGDEHDVGRGHVEPVVVEPGDPGLARGDRAGHHGRAAARSRPTGSAAPRTRRRRGSCARSTVIPRALASAPALTRLTRSVVEVSSRPRRTAAVSGVPS